MELELRELEKAQIDDDRKELKERNMRTSLIHIDNFVYKVIVALIGIPYMMFLVYVTLIIVGILLAEPPE